MKQKVVIGLVVGLTVSALIITAVVLAVVLTRTSGEEYMPVNLRIDCAPENTTGVSQSVCEGRGCIYLVDSNAADNDPVCFFSDAQQQKIGYDVIMDEMRTPAPTMTLKLQSRGQVLYDTSVKQLRAVFQPLSNELLRVKILDDENTRYEVPLNLNIPTQAANAPKYNFDVTNTSPFSFKISRKENGHVIFDTSPGGFVYENQFIQIVTKLNSTNFYGLGENLHKSLRHNFTRRMTWTAFTRDSPPNRGLLSSNLYGVQPFYMVVEGDGKAHGVFILNSNAMEYAITPAPYFIYRTIGGILDIIYIVENSPEMVIQKYHQLIGKPYMPPLWSLGFHLSRYGFVDLTKMQDAVNRTLINNFPLDVIHADIDHMDERKDFTIDPINYKELPQYIANLRTSEGVHTIMILDPCIIINETNYRPFDLGKEMDVFIKWPNQTIMPAGDYTDTNSTMMLGYVWPKGKVVFPDYLKDSAKSYWKILVKEHYSNLTFDGLWIDMNEPANFGTNQERPFNWPEKDRPYWSLKCPRQSKLDSPPYPTLATSLYHSDKYVAQLSDKTLCMDAIQHIGTTPYKHYDVHSLYGWSQSKPSLDALRNTTNKRGLILSRSTYPGSGRYAGHWLGDNDSNWPGLAESIIGMIEFNFFGYPFVGADICGFFGDAEEQMCTRWMQLGAFYPFSRNHNTIGAIDQDPGVFSQASVAAMRRAMEMRYRLLPFLYTLFIKVAISGGTVVRPLFFEYPTDSTALAVDRQFMWGPSLVISPFLDENQRSLRYYLPSGTWYRMTDSKACKCSGNPFDDGSAVTYSKVHGGQWYENDTISMQSIPELHIRAGSVLFTKQPKKTTKEMNLDNSFHLIVALDDNSNAAGELYWDDGESIDDTQQKMFHMSVNCQKDASNVAVCTGGVLQNSYTGMDRFVFTSVTVLGGNGNKCIMNGEEVGSGNVLNSNGNLLCYYPGDTHKVAANFTLEIPTV